MHPKIRSLSPLTLVCWLLACFDPRTPEDPEISLFALGVLPFQNQWFQLTGSAAWGARSGHDAVYLSGRYYLLGGRNAADVLQRDIWSSADGIEWRQETTAPHPTWNPSDNLGVTVHGGAIWVAAGFQLCGPDNSNCVFQSADGISWSPILADGHGQFPGRREHRLLSRNGLLYLLGGRTGLAPVARRVHSSADGSTWSLRVDPAPYLAARRPCVVSFRDRLWLIGGRREQIVGESVYFAEVWSSADGAEWTREVEAPGFSARNQHECFVFRNEIVLIGGTTDNVAGLAEVWTSGDGVNWRQRETPPWPPRRSFAVAYDGARVLLFGGADNASRYGDVWLGW